MKRGLLIILFVLVLLYIPSNNNAQETSQQEKGKVGIGFQSCFPVWGGSVMLNLNEHNSIQGMLGMLGDVKSYGGRYLYRFSNKQHSNTYGYGLLGAFSYTGYVYNENYHLEKKTETVFGYGAGLGVEYSWQRWMPDLFPLWWNIEIGFGSIKFEEVDYDFSAIFYGAGFHYYF